MPNTPTITASIHITSGAVHFPEPLTTPAFQPTRQPANANPISQTTANCRSFLEYCFQSISTRPMPLFTQVEIGQGTGRLRVISRQAVFHRATGDVRARALR